MIKISGKVDKSNTMALMAIFRSLLTEELHQTKHFLIFSLPLFPFTFSISLFISSIAKM